MPGSRFPGRDSHFPGNPSEQIGAEYNTSGSGFEFGKKFNIHRISEISADFGGNLLVFGNQKSGTLPALCNLAVKIRTRFATWTTRKARTPHIKVETVSSGTRIADSGDRITEQQETDRVCFETEGQFDGVTVQAGAALASSGNVTRLRRPVTRVGNIWQDTTDAENSCNDLRRLPVRQYTDSSSIGDATRDRLWDPVFMSSYEKVRGSKLTFKGGLGIEKKISKKPKKKKQEMDQLVDENGEGGQVAVIDSADPAIDIDTGTGHAPDGKKSKKYEELFPVETKRHGYIIPAEDSRSAALDERIKKKADRYCK